MTKVFKIDVKHLSALAEPSPPQVYTPPPPPIATKDVFASNDSLSIEQYEGRVAYKEKYSNNLYSIDTWYKHPYYGKIDTKGVLIGLRKTFVRTIKGSEVKLLGPAAIALEGLIQEYNSRIRGSGGELEEIVPFKGWQSLDEAYEEYLEEFYTRFDSEMLSFLKEDQKIKNIDDFSLFLTKYVKSTGRPFTLIGFLESKYNNPYTSGLYVDILAKDVTDDFLKEQFYNDINYELYSYLAWKHGFKVDINLPWRLVADLRIGSGLTEKIKFISPKTSTQEIIESYYDPLNTAAEFYVTSNKIIDFYNRFIENVEGNPEYVKFVEHDDPKGLFDTELVRRKEVSPTMEELQKLKYLTWYINLRNYEAGTVLNHGQIKNLTASTKRIFMYGKKENSERFFNLAIAFVEMAIGVPPARHLPADRKITVFKQNPVMLINANSNWKERIEYKPGPGGATPPAPDTFETTDVCKEFRDNIIKLYKDAGKDPKDINGVNVYTISCPELHKIFVQ